MKKTWAQIPIIKLKPWLTIVSTVEIFFTEVSTHTAAAGPIKNKYTIHSLIRSTTTA